MHKRGRVAPGWREMWMRMGRAGRTPSCFEHDPEDLHLPASPSFVFARLKGEDVFSMTRTAS